LNSASRFVIIVLFALLLSGMLGQLCAGEKKTNADILYQVCQEAVASSISEAQIPDTSTIVLKIEDGEINRFFAQPLTETFRQRFPSLFTRERTSGIEISVSVGGISVVYGQSFSDGFLSARRSERRIDVSIRMTAMRFEDRKILWAKSKDASFADTVYVDDIPDLQLSSERIVKGVMPQRSVMEKFIEPFIIVGAAGVAVYLFFTIRS
jgi:hypothetical protein